MGGICGIVHANGERTGDTVLETILSAGTFGARDIRTWSDGPISLAGPASAWFGLPGVVHEGAHSGGSAPEMPLVLADARLDGRAELISELKTASRHLNGMAAIDFDSLTCPGLISAAHAVWGDDAPSHLVGDYAYFVRDSPHPSTHMAHAAPSNEPPDRSSQYASDRRLLCVRDALGVRPLHFAWTPDGQTCVVASEARMVAAHPGIPIGLDETAAAAHLANRMPDGGRTILKGIRAVPPAHRLALKPDVLSESRPQRYWDVPVSREHWADDPSTSAERLRAALERTVADRLPRDEARDVGLLLSGGLDSASIGALAARRMNQGEGSSGLFACSYAFRSLLQCDETALAGALADRHGFPLIHIDVEREWLLQDEEETRADLDSPFIAWTAVTRRVMEVLRERDAGLLLTGHGGDNMIGGSPLAYASMLRRGRIDWLGEARNDARDRSISPALLIWSSAIRPLLPDGAARTARRLTGRGPAWRPPPWITPDLIRRSGLSATGRSSSVAGAYGDPAVRDARTQALDLGSVGRATKSYERAAAPYGIQVRHPFLDRRLVEVVLSVPPEHHYRDGRTKSSLRRAMRGDLTREIAGRSDKTSFSPYLDHSLRHASSSRVEQLIARPLAGELGLIDGAILRAGYAAYRSGRLPAAGNAVWAAVTLELWLQEHAHVLGIARG